VNTAPGAYPRVEHPIGASFGKAPALPANIRLGWKGLPEMNTLAYYENPYITAVRGFTVQAPGIGWRSTVVEHSLHNLKLKGSSPPPVTAAVTGREIANGIPGPLFTKLARFV
jgi:hypothetical protein